MPCEFAVALKNVQDSKGGETRTALKRLAHETITVDLLKSTRAGIILKQASKSMRPDNAALAKQILSNWKSQVFGAKSAQTNTQIATPNRATLPSASQQLSYGASSPTTQPKTHTTRLNATRRSSSSSSSSSTSSSSTSPSSPVPSSSLPLPRSNLLLNSLHHDRQKRANKHIYQDKPPPPPPRKRHFLKANTTKTHRTTHNAQQTTGKNTKNDEVVVVNSLYEMCMDLLSVNLSRFSGQFLQLPSTIATKLVLKAAPKLKLLRALHEGHSEALNDASLDQLW
jgi:hypothetical protein